MKLAHVSYKPSGGVVKKILSQASAARKLGLDLDFVVVTDTELLEGQNISFHKINWPRNTLCRKIKFNFQKYKTIGDLTDLSSYNRIILRYPGAYDLSFKRFFRENEDKIILEFHSFVIDEIKILEKGVLNPLRIVLEYLNATKVMSKSIGTIALTNEIRRRLEQKSTSSMPSVVISNGVDVKKMEFTKFRPFDGKTLNLIFISSTFYAYQGLDKLLSGLIRYKGNVRINLYLVGDIYLKRELSFLESMKSDRVCIHRLGRVYGDELNTYFREATIAVSTLALHRKNLSEACSLKTREYIARGIPFIYAYDDVDLTGREVFANKMSCDDKSLDIFEIISFAIKVSQRKDISEIMRDFAMRRLDWKNKVVKMYEFAESTLNNE